MMLRKNVLGGVFWILGSIVFVIGMIVAQIGYGPSYSLTQNHISDLGAVYCTFPQLGTQQLPLPGGVCSPWHDVFNISIIIDGILLVLGIVFAWTGFPKGKMRATGLGLLAAAGIGSAGVGLFPEDTGFLAHSLSALLVFIAGNIALILIGLSTSHDKQWGRYRIYSILSGSVGLVAFFLFLSMLSGPLGTGGMERLVVIPLLIWTLVISIHLIKSGTSSFTHPLSPQGNDAKSVTGVLGSRNLSRDP